MLSSSDSDWVHTIFFFKFDDTAVFDKDEAERNDKIHSLIDWLIILRPVRKFLAHLGTSRFTVEGLQNLDIGA